MDSSLSNLLILYAAMMLLNAVIAWSLWQKQKDSLYKKLLIVWLAIVVNLICNGITSNAPMGAVVFIGGGAMIVPTLAVANLLGSIVGFMVRWRMYFLVYFAGLGVSMGLYLYGNTGFTTVSFPIIFGAAFPLLHAPIQVLNQGNQSSFSLRLLVLCFFLSYLHMIDYPFLRMVPEFDLIGFTVAMFLFFAQSILSLAVVVEAIGDGIKEELENRVKDRTRELNERNEKLLDLNKEKNSLIAIVAHDLKSPLAAIKGFVGLFERERFSQDEQRFMTIIEESVDRLLKMISNILDIQKIESKKLNIQLQPTEILNPIKMVVKEMTNEADRKDISILMHADNKEVYVNLDELYFSSVLENLISNAIKFSPKRERVDVRVTLKDNLVFIKVQDYGPGISNAETKLLFRKYQKLSARPTGGESSTGLGLSIAKKHVEFMKGKIWCESQQGAGSKFIISFPVYENKKSRTKIGPA